MAIWRPRFGLGLALAIAAVSAVMLFPGEESAVATSSPPMGTFFSTVDVAQAATVGAPAVGDNGHHGDLWPSCWSDDNHVYSAYGDGFGFDSNYHDIGVARIAGMPGNLSGTQLAAGDAVGQVWTPDHSRKPTGMACVDGALYLSVQDLAFDFNSAPAATVAKSVDKGRTWTWDRSGPMFPNGVFTTIMFLDYGKDYANAPDGFVYAYGLDHNWRDSFNDRVPDPVDVYLARVPRDAVQDRSAWQFSSGLNSAGTPNWTSDINRRVAVLHDDRRLYQDVITPDRVRNLSVISQGGVVYNKPLNRYIYTSWTEYTFEFYESPTPWGPWKRMEARDFGGYPWTQTKHGGYATTIPSKYISADGKSMWLQSNVCRCGGGIDTDWAYTFSLRRLNLEPRVPTTPANVADPARNLAVEAGTVGVERALHGWYGDRGFYNDGVRTHSEDDWNDEYKTASWWGYTWPRTYRMNKVVYTTGEMHSDGGWFLSNLRVQVRRNNVWSDVTGQSTSPAYPYNRTAGPNHTYTLRFNDIDGDGVRIIGVAGGTRTFTSIGELEVYFSQPPGPVEYAVSGKYDLVYNTAAQSPPHYINDHAVIRGRDGTWHMFGITAPKAPPSLVPDSSREDQLAHATASSLQGPWVTQPHALTTDPNYHNEQHLWAPHVVEDNGTYYMFYAAGSGADAAINLATSTDLYTWTRHPGGPMFRDGWEARDPFVTRAGGRWVMYYTATAGGDNVVAYRTSSNLVDWGPKQVAYTDPPGNTQPRTESPVVMERNGWWYLFIGPRNGYVGTDVYRSTDPFRFQLGDYAGHLPSHAPEIEKVGNTWWATGAGWFQDGMYLAPMRWQDKPPVWQSAKNPAVARNADGRLEVFALGPDGESIQHRWQTTPNGGWSAWEWFGGPAGAVPTVGQNADGRLEVFAVGPNGDGLFHRWQLAPSGEWSNWESFGGWQAWGGAAGASPIVGRNADGRLEVFALSRGGKAIMHKWQLEANGDWSGWARFGGAASGPPVVGTNADGRLEVFAVSPAGTALMHRWQTSPSGAWSDWTKFGDQLARTPTVGQNADGRLEVFAQTPYEGSIMKRVQNGSGGWSAWEFFGTSAGAPPTTALNWDGRMEIFAIGPNRDYITHRWQTAANNGWSDWVGFGGPAQCAPTVEMNADGRLEVFALGPNGESIYHKWQETPGADWSAWEKFGDAAGGIHCGSPDLPN